MVTTTPRVFLHGVVKTPHHPPGLRHVEPHEVHLGPGKTCRGHRLMVEVTMHDRTHLSAKQPVVEVPIQDSRDEAMGVVVPLRVQ